MRVSALGEHGLLERIARRIGPPPPSEVWAGDDAAVVPWPDAQLLLTTDVVVEGIDFRLEWSSPEDAGWKAVAASVSDIAAMGGRPQHAVASLALPAETPVALVDELLDGMLAAAARWGVSLVGGDLSGATELSLAIAAVGAAGQGGPVLRSAACPGDCLCVTGSLGGARAGLVALERGARSPDPETEAARARQLRPLARVDEGVALAAAGARAMIDISDGLVVDLGRLMAASGTGCDVDADAVPVDPAVEPVARRWALDALETALVGGEDYELLLTMEETLVDAAHTSLEAIGTPLTRIGVVTEGPARIGGRELASWREESWEHLRPRLRG
ncbi:MAG TPA: thiamine-phosphate kinase [Actinomycetota bacterium]|nr:thiamine-phosphate kinase [Actinomycetota bacterium]